MGPREVHVTPESAVVALRVKFHVVGWDAPEFPVEPSFFIAVKPVGLAKLRIAIMEFAAKECDGSQPLYGVVPCVVPVVRATWKLLFPSMIALKFVEPADQPK